MWGWIVAGAAVLLIGVGLMFLLSFTSAAPSRLGVVCGRFAPCPASPNCVCSQADDREHWITPLTVQGDVTRAMTRLRAAVLEIPRTVVVEQSASYLRVEFRSAFFRFVDDAEFWLEPESGRIHLRSCSRAGHSDLGVNRRRAEQIRRSFSRADRFPSGASEQVTPSATSALPKAAGKR